MIILHTLKKIKNMFHAVLPIKLFVLMISQMFFIEEKMWFIDLLKQFLKSMIIAVE